MNKNILIVVVLCLAAGLLGGLFLVTLQKHNREKSRIERFPKFEAMSLAGEKYFSSDDPPARRTAILFFSPACDYCRTELENIVRRGNKWDGVKWLFVTISDRESVQNFVMDCPIDAIPNAQVLLDEDGSVVSHFQVTAPPVLHVYDENLCLIHSGKGATSISVITDWLQ